MGLEVAACCNQRIPVPTPNRARTKEFLCQERHSQHSTYFPLLVRFLDFFLQAAFRVRWGLDLSPCSSPRTSRSDMSCLPHFEQYSASHSACPLEGIFTDIFLKVSVSVAFDMKPQEGEVAMRLTSDNLGGDIRHSLPQPAPPSQTPASPKDLLNTSSRTYSRQDAKHQRQLLKAQSDLHMFHPLQLPSEIALVKGNLFNGYGNDTYSEMRLSV